MSEELRRLQTLEALAHASVLLAKQNEKSMQRPFWYLRPSHRKLMSAWGVLSDIFDEYLQAPTKTDKTT